MITRTLGIGVPAETAVRLMVSVVVNPSWDAVEVDLETKGVAVVPHPAATIADAASARVRRSTRGFENLLMSSLFCSWAPSVS
jgi:hypothetical protein